MLEILCKVSFFLSMLVAYAYVTSTSRVIAIVLVYSLCVFSYYYFNVIQNAIDEFFKFINFNEKLNGSVNSSQVPIPYVSPVESASFHNIKYPSISQMSNYRFDKSTLRHISKVPRINSTPTVRIAPPEPISVNHLNEQYISNHDRYSEDIRNDDDKYLQVLREISRKRNYQEESDRIDSTPKKSRRNDIKNFMTSQSKRSHDDSSYDNLDDTSRKKRCSDFDRSVAKILSYTSSLMHIVAPNVTWSNHSKKRKSSKIEKSTNESPENVEKLRKINHEQIAEDVENYCDERTADNCTNVVEQQTVPAEVHENFESHITKDDEGGSRSVYEPPLPDDDGEYVKVASGKILNRTNCTYRKKLNSNRIDPQSVITLEPELANGFSNEDDETMKNNLVRNLIDDIERKGEKDESVIFYENSIVEEIAQNQNKIASAKPDLISNNSTSFNPLLSKPMPAIDAENKPSFDVSVASGPSAQPPVSKQLELPPSSIIFGTNSTNTQTKPDCNPTSNSSTVFNSSVSNYSTFNTNPVTCSTFNSNQTSDSFAFENNTQDGIDTVDSTPKPDSLKPKEEKDQIETAEGSVNNNAVSFTSSVISTTGTTVISSSHGGPFSCVAIKTPSSTPANSTSMVNSTAFNTSVSSTQQMSPVDTVNTMKSGTPAVTFGATTTSPFTLGAKNDAALIDSAPSVPQFGAFAASGNTIKPAENVQSNPLSGITMFGSTAICPSISGTSNSNASSTSVSSFTNTTPSGGFQFGKSTTPNTKANTGFSFGSSTTSSTNGFTLGTTSAPSAFSVSTPAFGTSSTSSFNTTSLSSFASPASSAFGASSGLKFDATPSQPAASFSVPTFNATTTASSFAAPSLPSFANSQPPTFGSTNGAFGTAAGSSQETSAFSNPSSSQSAFGSAANSSLNFGNTPNQPQPTPAFGNPSSQSNSTFGASQPAFGTVQSTMFGSGDPSILSRPAKPSFGTTNSSQFGTSTGFTFGGTSADSQPQPLAFGSAAPVSTPFGSSAAAQPSSFNSASTFSFGATNGPSSFGGNGFGATNVKPVENTFGFGGNNVASAPAPAQQNLFQFGSAPQQAPQSQPFTFGANSGGNTGGFSIGAGGSTRSRTGRTRRK